MVVHGSKRHHSPGGILLFSFIYLFIIIFIYFFSMMLFMGAVHIAHEHHTFLSFPHFAMISNQALPLPYQNLKIHVLYLPKSH